MDIDQLISLGQYDEAAKEARRLGDLVRAQKLYERIWDFRAAAEVARERGDRPELLRLLLEARDFAAAARVNDAIHRGAVAEQEQAALVYERHRQWAEAAALRERLGQLERARAHFQSAQLPLDVARLDEALGRLREAGMIYERFLTEEPNAEEAPRAHLRLGFILAGFGQHDEAVRQLQRGLAKGAPAPNGDGSEAPARETHRTAIEPAALNAARRLLVVELAKLGYREAARAALAPLLTADPSLGSLERFLTAEAQAHAATRLGDRYRVERLLGSGGMGRVYLAHDELNDRQVAVKVVAPPVDSRSAEGYQRFLREAAVVSALHDPHIVSVLAVHEALGLLVTEYLPGGTLADRLGTPQPPERVRSWGLALLAALEAAHAHGVVHRDVKPANVFFSAAGEAKLGDFGVAHLSDLGATQTAGFIGTLAYMAPEQISGAPLTFAADLYALGVTLFQALTGRLPFCGPDFASQHLGEPPPRASSFRPELHPGWDALLSRALGKAPDDRFSSVEAMRHELVAIPLTQAALPATAVVAPPVPSPEGQRYAILGAEGELTRATDTRLGREVLIELLPAEAPHLPWLRAMARLGGPRLQRVLRLEPLADGALRVVYEALSGRSPISPSLTPAAGALLARALEPLHQLGLTHGSISDSLLFEQHGPVLLLAGRRPTPKSVPEEERELAQLIAPATASR